MPYPHRHAPLPGRSLELMCHDGCGSCHALGKVSSAVREGMRGTDGVSTEKSMCGGSKTREREGAGVPSKPVPAVPIVELFVVFIEPALLMLLTELTVLTLPTLLAAFKAFAAPIIAEGVRVVVERGMVTISFFGGGL